MNKFLFLLALLCFAWKVDAHQPDLSSTLLVEQEDGLWILQVRAALTAFEYEVEQHFGKEAYASPEEFQTLVLQHISEHITLNFGKNNNTLLQKGQVKLGHETSVTFEVKNVPKIIEELEIQNTSFATISRNQSALVVLKKGLEKDQFKLDAKNEHRVKLAVQGKQFRLLDPKQEQNDLLYLMPVAVIIAIGFLLKTFLARSLTQK